MNRANLAKIWQMLLRFLQLSLGTLIAGTGYSLFQVPHNIADGGVSGIAIIITRFTDWPIGVMVLVMNIPLLILGYFYLGRWRFLLRTIYAVFLFSTTIDVLSLYLPTWLPQYPLTDDLLLSAIYGGIVVGIGSGLIYRSGGTSGGTSILGRILQQKTGTPLSQVYFYTDGLIILTAGAVFGWEIALYALLAMFLSGLASDYTLEGPGRVRTATIITDRAQAIIPNLMINLDRGVTTWEITGAYTGRPHTMLMCTVDRSQVNELKRIVAAVDQQAFVIIGTAHQVLGSGFQSLES